ncbi:hypothetical protein GCK72_011366 [Caenorhabditis remanei]|uniref:RING-type domain-containing protein n=1 Tax=Caenorhabditis remanei TaxID=31234 RepID=A0A6A5H8B3_CAERE|nr:hypothetical protein GCK72_011366 [Caenorhabditis remanei]KAF1763101.1 hypothetical protein GCK72_011366 [Caenorhabditis remanei]
MLQYDYSMMTPIIELLSFVVVNWDALFYFSVLIASTVILFWSEPEQPEQPDSEDEGIVDDVVENSEENEDVVVDSAENQESESTEPPEEKGIRIPDCKICLIPFSTSAYSTPRALQCGHSICTNCAVTLLEDSDYLSIECPFCRKFTRGYKKKIESIKTNYAVMGIIEKLTGGGRFNPKCFRCHSGYSNQLTECTPRVQMDCGHTLCEICIRTWSSRSLRCPECFLTGLGGRVTVWQSAKRRVCRMFRKNRIAEDFEKKFPKNFVILEMLESFPCDSTCDSTAEV